VYTVDDREIVAAIVAGDPAGLAEAYDRYADPLHSYCRWMLDDPAGAAGTVQDTYVAAASRLRGLSDPGKLRPWLYAVARNECYRRLAGVEPTGDRALDMADQSDPGEDSEQAELRWLVRSTLNGLSPAEREVTELDLRHGLHGADLAVVLGVPLKAANALSWRARERLEKELGALLMARTGRRACRDLEMLLVGWDGRMTALTRTRVSRHVERCEVCTRSLRGLLRPAVVFGMPPLAALPTGLREDVLALCTDWDLEVLGYRQEVTEGAGPFRPDGFPKPVARPRTRKLALSGIAAAAGVVVALAATGVVTVLALTGSHTPHRAEAARSPSGAASASSTPASSGIIAAPALPTPKPATSKRATSAPPSAVVATSPAPTKAKPTPTHTVTTPAVPSVTPTPSVSAPVASVTPTPSVSPSTTPATTTPSPTLTTTSITPPAA
jgi:RNA polymerase sigma factor (sigma-70 family)